MHNCSRLPIVKSPLQPTTLNKKLSNISLPCNVKSTSGWNCTPYSLRFSSAIPAIKLPLRAITLNPSATVPSTTLSPCVKSTRCLDDNPLNSR
uniref:Uncharacterized protein n=1 Tax=Parascaris univalens TaxID=6257 RepID=A0A915BD42_PARUN